jgi:hypothetical protein
VAAAREATSFCQPIGLGATFNPELVEALFTMAAYEARVRGTHQALTPVVDVARDPRWGRVEETYGEDPYLNMQLGMAAVRGFQGDGTFKDKRRIIATIPLVWAIFADVADYSEWTIGRRFTGMVFATIGFALKSGLALGSASFLWIMEGFFHYDTRLPGAPDAVAGYRFTSGIVVGLLFAVCTALLAVYQLNKATTLKMAEELAQRRQQHSTNQPQYAAG